MKTMNLRIVREKLIPLLLAGSLSITLTGCRSKKDLNPVSFHDLMSIEDIRESTYLDELIVQNELMFDESLSYLDAADQLIEYMDMVEMLEKYSFSDTLPTHSILNLSREDVSSLISILKSKDNSLESISNKEIATMRLSDWYAYCKQWIHANGKKISEKVMLNSIKSNIASGLNIPLYQYSKIVIPPYRSVSKEPEAFIIKVYEDEYTVPLNSEEIWNTIRYLYLVQSSTLDQDTEYATYRKAVHLAKITLSAGSVIKNHKVKVKNELKTIEKEYLTK